MSALPCARSTQRSLIQLAERLAHPTGRSSFIFAILTFSRLSRFFPWFPPLSFFELLFCALFPYFVRTPNSAKHSEKTPRAHRTSDHRNRVFSNRGPIIALDARRSDLDFQKSIFWVEKKRDCDAQCPGNNFSMVCEKPKIQGARRRAAARLQGRSK